MEKRKPTLTRIEKMLQADGALCVTYCNTEVRQPLASYDDLLAWGLDTGALNATDGRRLAAAAAESPGLGHGVLRSARNLAVRLTRILHALIAGHSPSAADLRELNISLSRAMVARRLDPTGKRWTWGDTEGDDFDRMLWPVLLSVAELLTSEDRDRVRLCAGQDCGLLFVARGSGRVRRWCDASCSSRHSSRKHYARRIKPKRQQWAQERAGRQSMRLAGYDTE